MVSALAPGCSVAEFLDSDDERDAELEEVEFHERSKVAMERMNLLAAGFNPFVLCLGGPLIFVLQPCSEPSTEISKCFFFLGGGGLPLSLG